MITPVDKVVLAKALFNMNLFAVAFPEMEIFAASLAQVAQATSLGAALSIHIYWNNKTLPLDLIDLRFYNSHLTSDGFVK
jgi:L-fuculokinase